jgi:hypothetical protein
MSLVYVKLAAVVNTAMEAFLLYSRGTHICQKIV